MTDLNLERILTSIEFGEKAPADKIFAKRVHTRKTDIGIYLGIAGDRKMHLLVGPVRELDAGELSAIQLRTLSTSIREWSVEKGELGRFVDVACEADFESQARTPFLAFCEDVVRHLDKEASPVFDVLKKVFRRWRRFWTGDQSALPSGEWIRGLIGELAFLKDLTEKFSEEGLKAWEGPNGGIHDFSANDIAFEIKTSQSHPVTIQVHGLSQLDEKKWDSLHIVLYRLEADMHGRSLADLVNNIEDIFTKADLSLEDFWEKLARAGYRRDLEHVYHRNRYRIDSPQFFKITSDFPRLTKTSFSGPIDMRIFDISYRIELTGIEPETPNLVDAAVKKMLKPLK